MTLKISRRRFAFKPPIADCSRRGLQVILLIAGIFNSGAAFSTSTMRCGNRLVELGDDKLAVEEICGEPRSIVYRTKILGNTLHHPQRTLDIQQYEEIAVEEWIYDFGRHRIRQAIRFENGILVEIKDLGGGR